MFIHSFRVFVLFFHLSILETYFFYLFGVPFFNIFFCSIEWLGYPVETIHSEFVSFSSSSSSFCFVFLFDLDENKLFTKNSFFYVFFFICCHVIKRCAIIPNTQLNSRSLTSKESTQSLKRIAVFYKILKLELKVKLVANILCNL